MITDEINHTKPFSKEIFQHSSFSELPFKVQWVGVSVNSANISHGPAALGLQASNLALVNSEPTGLGVVWDWF